MASLKKRGKSYYAQICVGGNVRRVSLRTNTLQVAKEKLRQIESALARRDDIPLPTRTPIATVLAEYVQHLNAHKTARSVRADLFYLRQAFGPCCPELKPTRAEDRPTANRLHIGYLEDLTTGEISRFLAVQVQQRGFAPKTANRYREVLHTLMNWAMRERGVRTPGGKNPVTSVARYKERAPEIRFPTLPHIAEQLEILAEKPLLQTMVAVYIYAGLRREETIWLTLDDVDLKTGPYGQNRIRAKTVSGEWWEPKTKVNRAVPISRALRSYLDRYEVRIVPGRWYFPSPEGKRWDADIFSADLRTANVSAHLP